MKVGRRTRLPKNERYAKGKSRETALVKFAI